MEDCASGVVFGAGRAPGRRIFNFLALGGLWYGGNIKGTINT